MASLSSANIWRPCGGSCEVGPVFITRVKVSTRSTATGASGACPPQHPRQGGNGGKPSRALPASACRILTPGPWAAALPLSAAINVASCRYVQGVRPEPRVRRVGCHAGASGLDNVRCDEFAGQDRCRHAPIRRQRVTNRSALCLRPRLCLIQAEPSALIEFARQALNQTRLDVPNGKNWVHGWG